MCYTNFCLRRFLVRKHIYNVLIKCNKKATVQMLSTFTNVINVYVLNPYMTELIRSYLS